MPIFNLNADRARVSCNCPKNANPRPKTLASRFCPPLSSQETAELLSKLKALFGCRAWVVAVSWCAASAIAQFAQRTGGLGG